MVPRVLDHYAPSQRTMEFLESHEVIRSMAEYGAFVHKVIQGGP